MSIVFAMPFVFNSSADVQIVGALNSCCLLSSHFLNGDIKTFWNLVATNQKDQGIIWLRLLSIFKFSIILSTRHYIVHNSPISGNTIMPLWIFNLYRKSDSRCILLRDTTWMTLMVVRSRKINFRLILQFIIMIWFYFWLTYWLGRMIFYCRCENLLLFWFALFFFVLVCRFIFFWQIVIWLFIS